MTDDLTAEELRACAYALGAWESEFNVGGDQTEWEKMARLAEKLRRMADALEDD